jgi:DNA-directed RNA polymerase subunit RPC12/RpoP
MFSRFPYRCHNCGHRYLVYRFEERPSDVPLSSTEREIQRTRLTLRRKRGRRIFLLYGSALLVFLVFLYYITRERAPQSD